MTSRRGLPVLAGLLGAALCSLLVSCASTPGTPVPPAAVVGRWTGSVEAGQLASVAIIVVFDEKLSGTIDIPAQDKSGLALTGVVVEPPRVRFELPIDDGVAIFEGRLRGDTIQGTFTQGSLEATFSLHRAAAP
jgi:hypothetical protein